jgi:type II secretion system protein N
MRALMWIVGGFFWGIAVFFVTFFLTFPSKTVSERLRYEIPNLLGRDYSGEIGSVRPWWIGLSANDIKLYKAPGRGESEEEGPQLVALLGNLRMRVSPWSMMRRAPYVSGSVTLTEGEMDYAIGTAVDQRSNIALSDLVLGAEAMPLGDLFLLVPGLTATGSGAIDLEVDLHAGEDGMRDATGHISLSGTGLSLSDIELPTVGALGIEVPISELALTADVAEGVANITTGKLESEIATVAVSGNVTLRDPIDRSAVDIQIVLSDLGEALAPFAGFMSAAKESDGNYHYSCRGVLSRLGPNSCTAGERSPTTSSSRGSARTPSAVTPGGSSPITPRTTGTTPSPREAESDEERERRRDEIRERLRQKREEREAERAAGAVPAPPVEDPIDLEEEPEHPEDDLEIEEPPPEGEDGELLEE